MISQAILVTTLLLLATGQINSRPVLPMAPCPTTCGNLTIPFPFGATPSCSLDDSFLIDCNHSYSPPKPFLNSSTVEVLEISLDGVVKIASTIASDCYDDSGWQTKGTISELTLSTFSISSTRNKFTAVGCDTHALIQGSKGWEQMSAGCVSWCDSIDSVVNNSCSGIGCCQTSIPRGVKDFSVDIRSFINHTKVQSFNPCGYAFVVEANAFSFSSSDLKDLRNRMAFVPIVLDWSVGNSTCKQSRENVSSFACRSTNSVCNDSSSDVGYNCNCLAGFQGNAYLVDGCQDINECDALQPCEGKCKNLEGSYSCSCPEGSKGDGRKDGSGCHSQSRISGSTFLYVVSGFLVPAFGSSWIFWRRKQKKVDKLRQSAFERNGGLLLVDYMKQSDNIKLTIFTAEQLKEATNNYDESKVVCKGYKGTLLYDTVYIKKCSEHFSYNTTEDFISNLVILSQVNHRNTVRLLGCCLETQDPLLVYEFVSAKTLYDYIRDDVYASYLSWDIRLKIAAEIAGVLAYMHYDPASAIIHGTLSSSSILLHHHFTAKVIDFVDSSFELCSGRFGYIDPEYFICQRLTTKSDVYSFGVVLAELLTGQKAIDSGRPVGEELLAQFFVSSMRRDHLVSILDGRLETEGKIEQLTQLARLAESCLSDSSNDRPTMQQVVIALQNAINGNSLSTTIPPLSIQGTTSRRLVRRNKSL